MATVTRTLRNFVDGEHADPVEGRSEPILNPATGEQIATAPLSDAADVDRAVQAARRAFDGWSNATPGRALARAAEARRRGRGSTATSWRSWRRSTPASRSRR